MIRELQFQIPAEEIVNVDFIRRTAAQKSGIPLAEIDRVEILRRSIDARQRSIRYNLRVAIYCGEDKPSEFPYFRPIPIDESKCVDIIGAGPAGLFAALQALVLGLKPIIYERGKDVRSRRRDLVQIHRNNEVDSESNYCFGEGGAGTYSDGKLYTRSKKKELVRLVLKWFIHFGADPDIAVDTHPHIGTNKLPKIITSIRNEIIRLGGEIHFESKLTDLRIEDEKIRGFEINGDEWISSNYLILATGHSARDIFYLLHKKGISLLPKSFALGVRIEHSQELIDRIQYHGRLNNEYLPPASYSLVTQADGRGVYSFCMCPGGIIAPCATDNKEVVTNGWSPSKRNNAYANSGIVVELHPWDLGNPNDPFVCLNFQKSIEHKCWVAAGRTQKVPAQRMIDFIHNKKSQDLPTSSYQPGITSVNLRNVFPDIIVKALTKGFQDFGKKKRGYLSNDAVLHAPESRTSSPIEIPRKNESTEHVDIEGLYPCGEGAGYAGGIVSAAIDGMMVMQEIRRKIDGEGPISGLKG